MAVVLTEWNPAHVWRVFSESAFRCSGDGNPRGLRTSTLVRTRVPPSPGDEDGPQTHFRSASRIKNRGPRRLVLYARPTLLCFLRRREVGSHALRDEWGGPGSEECQPLLFFLEGTWDPA